MLKSDKWALRLLLTLTVFHLLHYLISTFIRCGLTCCMLLTCFVTIADPYTYSLKTDTIVHDLNGHLQILEDSSAQLTFDDVKNQLDNFAFTELADYEFKKYAS